MLVLAAPTTQAQAPERPFGTLREQAAMQQEWLKKRLDTFLPAPVGPQYVLRNKATGERRTTQDPGRALVTGRFADIARFKVPGLRGLAGRAPYFHSGAATDLFEVVKAYDDRFGIGLSGREQQALVAFLQSL